MLMKWNVMALTSLLLFGMTDLELWDLTLHNYYCQSSPFLSEELEDLGPCGAELW